MRKTILHKMSLVESVDFDIKCLRDSIDRIYDFENKTFDFLGKKYFKEAIAIKRTRKISARIPFVVDNLHQQINKLNAKRNELTNG